MKNSYDNPNPLSLSLFSCINQKFIKKEDSFGGGYEAVPILHLFNPSTQQRKRKEKACYFCLDSSKKLPSILSFR